MSPMSILSFLRFELSRVMFSIPVFEYQRNSSDSNDDGPKIVASKDSLAELLNLTLVNPLPGELYSCNVVTSLSVNLLWAHGKSMY